MAEGIYKYRKEKPKKVYMKPQIGFGNISYASDKKKKYEKPSVSVKMKANRELAKHDTEVGHSEKLKKALADVEERTRNLKDEQLNVFDENGNKVYFIQGKGAEVKHSAMDSFVMRELSKKQNIIMTHNHPRAIGKEGFGAIGHSFSAADMASAVTYNAAEMRAATPTFTFSFKRPKNGWGATKQQVEAAYKREHKKLLDELWEHEKQRGRIQIYKARTRYHGKMNDRANVYLVDELNRRIAKKFGWDYTSRQIHPTRK